MLDPFDFLESPEWLRAAITPLCHKYGLYALPYHFTHALLAFAIYLGTMNYLSPALSPLLFPRHYPKLSARTRLNWDVHVVSLLQSVLISTLSYWVISTDPERAVMGWRERIWGYTGAGGMVHAFGHGYFVWDLYVCLRHFDLFGPGMLAHAVAALTVYTFGFRPFVNFYAPNFLLYELSSPFLNVHWFCDKLNMTGGTVQMINGVILLVTFFSCRLVYGIWSSYGVLSDILKARNLTLTQPSIPPLASSPFAAIASSSSYNSVTASQVLKFAPATASVPDWLVLAYAGSNIMLNLLNVYWFQKMIETIRKRFDPPWGTHRAEKDEQNAAGDGVKDATGVDGKDGELRKRPVPVRVISDFPPPT